MKLCYKSHPFHAARHGQEVLSVKVSTLSMSFIATEAFLSSTLSVPLLHRRPVTGPRIDASSSDVRSACCYPDQERWKFPHVMSQALQDNLFTQRLPKTLRGHAMPRN
eukprot:5996357-Amphidinium_carterae.1